MHIVIKLARFLLQDTKYQGLTQIKQEVFCCKSKDYHFCHVLRTFSLTPQLIDNGFFDLKTVANLIRLNIFVEVLIADPSLEKESEKVFFSNPMWMKISLIAKKTLEQMGIPLVYPEFKHL